MDNFISLAKKGYAAYEQSQSQQNVAEGQDHQQQQQHSTPSTTQHKESHENLPVDHNQAAEIANSHSGGSGSNELFSQALSYLGSANHSTPVNEEHVTKAHEQVYGGGDTSNLSANAIGGAAALQVLKNYMSGGDASQKAAATAATPPAPGGDFQTKMIGMAMSEAAKMFDKTSGTTGDKQDAVNGAASTMFKLMVQSKLSGGGTTGSGGGVTSLLGGENSGGLNSLLSMASKYTSK